MRDLTAQVTSSLLPFPRVTLDALGEDEITLDSVLHGRFTVGKITFVFFFFKSSNILKALCFVLATVSH